MLIKNIGLAFSLIGALAFSSLFLFGVFGLSIIPSASALTYYFISFSGALLFAWGILLSVLPTTSEFKPVVVKVTVIMLILFAFMRAMAFFIADEVFTFLPVFIAKILTVSEVALFLFLAYLLKKQQD